MTNTSNRFVIPAHPNQSWNFIVSEARGYRSREEGVVAAGIGKLIGGTIMGKVTASAPSAPTIAAGGSNVGNGLVQGEPTINEGAPVGVYKLKFIDANRFQVSKPNGANDDAGDEDTGGIGHVGEKYTGIIDVLVNAGTTAFAAADVINITFTDDYSSVGTFKPWAPGASDGTQNFAGILSEETDATVTAQKKTFFVRDMEAQRAMLSYVGNPTPTQMNAVLAQMAAAGIALR